MTSDEFNRSDGRFGILGIFLFVLQESERQVYYPRPLLSWSVTLTNARNPSGLCAVVITAINSAIINGSVCSLSLSLSLSLCEAAERSARETDRLGNAQGDQKRSGVKAKARCDLQ